MNLCMAATYDPDPRAPNGFRIPFNAETGEVILERWRNWRRHDPINLVAKYRANLKSLRGIYIDCGWRDQYHIHYGSRLLSQRLADAGIKHRYEEFDDDHSDIDYRMDVSLPFLSIKCSRVDTRNWHFRRPQTKWQRFTLPNIRFRNYKAFDDFQLSLKMNSMYWSGRTTQASQRMGALRILSEGSTGWIEENLIQSIMTA